MREYLEEVKTFPAEWVTDETPSRKVTLLGRSGIDPDIYVARLAGVEKQVWVMTYSGSIIDTNPPVKAMPAPSPNPLHTTEGVTQGWQVPDGWKLVPVEPTEEMLLASWMAQYIIAGATEQEAVEIAKRRWVEEKADVFKAYGIMIAAAPLPPPPGQ